MKLASYVLFLFSLLHSPVSLISQTPSWSWARNGGGTLVEYAWAVDNDNAGNAYITGGFESGTATFGAFPLSNAMADSLDIFIAKYDANGNILWADQTGGVRNDEATSITVDNNGDIIITGYFYSASITFGTYTLNNTSGYSDLFIAKYNSAGTVLWAYNVGGVYDDRGNSVRADANNNIVVTGYFLADSIFFGSDTLLCAGTYDMLVLKYDSNGNPLWATSAGNSGDDRGQSIATDAAGNVIVGGTFRVTPLIIGNDTLTYAGGAYSDLFIAKYDSNGNILWALDEGGTYLDETNGLVTDASGNIYMAAIVYSSTIIIGNDTLTNSGSAFYCEAVVAKYDANGNAIWAQNHGVPTTNDIAYGIDIDTAGNVCVTGAHGSNITFGTYTLSGIGLFVVKYDPAGAVLWAITNTGALAYGLSCDSNGDILVTGIIYDPTITIGSDVLANAGIYDVFVGRLSTSTGIFDSQSTSQFSVYPNPSNGILFFDGLITSHEYSVTVINTLGEVVKQLKVTGDKPQINCSDLSRGMYLISVSGNSSGEQSNSIIVIE